MCLETGEIVVKFRHLRVRDETVAPELVMGLPGIPITEVAKQDGNHLLRVVWSNRVAYVDVRHLVTLLTEALREVDGAEIGGG